MTVVGVGVDLVEIERMRGVLARTPGLIERAFTAGERTYCEDRADPTERYAARFAAKEAVLKVLDRSILGTSLRDIEVVRAKSGKPSVVLHGKVAACADGLGITTWHLTMTHTASSALAVAVGLAEPIGAGEEHLADAVVLPEAGGALLEEAAFYASLDRKRNAAGALLWDATGRLLIVKPTYRPGWTLPGGGVDAGESPAAACEREITEELGLIRQVGTLRAVDWDAGDPVRGEAVLWVFEGGVLSDDEVATIRLPEGELSEHAFVEPEDAVARLWPPQSASRLEALLATDAGTTLYLEGGRPAISGN